MKRKDKKLNYNRPILIWQSYCNHAGTFLSDRLRIVMPNGDVYWYIEKHDHYNNTWKHKYSDKNACTKGKNAKEAIKFIRGKFTGSRYNESNISILGNL